MAAHWSGRDCPTGAASIRGRAGGITFDPDQRPGDGPTAKLTPDIQAKLTSGSRMSKKGIEWDPISTCAPPGPSALAHRALPPRVHRHAESDVADQRDGQRHPPHLYRWPRTRPPERIAIRSTTATRLASGTATKLVIHTNQLQAGIYQRRIPTTPIRSRRSRSGRRPTDKLIEVDVWVYDPPALVEPWYTKQSYVEARRSGQEPAHPLLALRRESEQRRRETEGRRHAVQGLHVRSEATDAQKGKP